MFHVKMGGKRMKMESDMKKPLIWKFRYRKMQTLDLLLVSNYEDFYGKLNLQYLANIQNPRLLQISYNCRYQVKEILIISAMCAQNVFLP